MWRRSREAVQVLELDRDRGEIDQINNLEILVETETTEEEEPEIEILEEESIEIFEVESIEIFEVESIEILEVESIEESIDKETDTIE